MSSKKQLESLGERMKTYERLFTESKLIPNLPVYVRLDGRGFSRFTKKMNRPYDDRLSGLMHLVTKFLVEEFDAIIGYSQSDEISLILKNGYESPCIFNGKIQKLTSTMASYATAVFNSYFSDYFEDLKTSDFCNRLPTFDCRVFNVPNESEAVNAIYWRYLDAIKNSKQMLAQHYFSHKELQGLNGKVIVDKLKLEKNIIWESYPEYFKSGVFIRRDSVVIDGCIYGHVDLHSGITKPFNEYSHEERVSLIFPKEVINEL